MADNWQKRQPGVQPLPREGRAFGVRVLNSGMRLFSKKVLAVEVIHELNKIKEIE